MDLTPAQQADFDQAHAAALSDLEEFIAKHGAQAAAHFMLGELLESARANGPRDGIYVLGGTAALALVELARREVA